MFAMPGATIRFCVLASSQEECTSTLRPRLSGSHSAEYPQLSTRVANSAPSAAVSASIGAQTPSLPSCIVRPDRLGLRPEGILAAIRADGARLRPDLRKAAFSVRPSGEARRPARRIGLVCAGVRAISTDHMPTLFLIVFVDLVGFGLVIPLLPFYAERFTASPLAMTALFATFSLMSFLTAPLWGRLSDRVGRRPVLMASMAASTLAYGWMAFATHLWMLFAARAFAGACAGNIAAAQAYIADVTPPDQRAKGMGMIGAAFGLGFIIGPVLGGVIAGGDVATADLTTPCLIAAFLSFLGFLGVVLLLPESLAQPGRADRSEE